MNELKTKVHSVQTCQTMSGRQGFFLFFVGENKIAGFAEYCRVDSTSRICCLRFCFSNLSHLHVISKLLANKKKKKKMKTVCKSRKILQIVVFLRGGN